MVVNKYGVGNEKELSPFVIIILVSMKMMYLLNGGIYHVYDMVATPELSK